jgi:hypothetical protein
MGIDREFARPLREVAQSSILNLHSLAGSTLRIHSFRFLMQSFDFQVVLNCPLDLVFAIYTDIDRWQNRNLFGEIRWVKGKPWEEGSRLQIETRVPIRSTIDQVVQEFIPTERVSYLSHVFGITCETRVTFIRVSDRETAVNVNMELIGKVTRSLGFALEPLIMKSTKGFFDELRRECETAARNLHPEAE